MKKPKFRFTKFHITLLLSVTFVAIMVGTYWYSTTHHPVTADITPATRTVQMGGKITFVTGSPAAGIYIALDGTGIITANDGRYLTLLEIPIDQDQISVSFYNQADKIYQSTDGEDSVFITGGLVQQDFVIEPAVP